MDNVQSQVNEVKVILTDNISKVLERGERLDDLIDKTDDLQASVSICDPLKQQSSSTAVKYNLKILYYTWVFAMLSSYFSDDLT